jgi:hypothetical protein
MSIQRAAILCVLALVFLPGLARAQAEVTLESLQIELRPEYDEPSMLVIYQARVSPSVQLPVELAFRIPVAAGRPEIVAVRTETGSAFNVDYSYNAVGNWGVITFPATLPNIQIEYYDPTLDRSADLRQYTYTWPGDISVERTIMSVQQPLGARNIRTEPQLGSIDQDQNGLIFHWSEVGSLRAGETFDIQVIYQKTAEALTVEFLPIRASGPVDIRTLGRVSLVDIIPWGAGLLGVLLMVVGVYWYWVSGQRRGLPDPAIAALSNRAAELDDKGSPASDRFCHQCGKRAVAGDQFCRACGTRHLSV